MSPQSVRAREATTATPAPAGAEFAFAYEFLLAAVQPLVALAIVLARKGLSAHGAHERALVGVGAQVRAKVVGASEAFGAEVALEGSRMFLNPFVASRGGGAGGIGQFENVVAVGDGGGGGAARGSRRGGFTRLVG